MAWQVGVRKYEKKMKILKNRRGQVEEFVKNDKYNSIIRGMVKMIKLEDDSKITVDGARLLFVDFMGSTKEGCRVSY